jgi:GNAT superfamily N-acetyltransferase
LAKPSAPRSESTDPKGGRDLTKLERIIAELPAGFDALRAEAQREGYRHLDRLVEEWNTNRARFDQDGEALFAAWVDADLAGIGGLTIDPVLPGALRMRRFYVARSSRRTGIGRAIAKSLLAQPRASGRTVTVNAGAGSEPFWESLGFVRDPKDGHTHVLRRPSCLVAQPRG